MSSENDIKILKIENNDTNDVYNLLIRSFFKDEPLNFNSHTPPKTANELFALKGIPQGYSLKVIDYQGNIIAVCLNTNINKMSRDSVEPSTDRIKKIFQLMKYIDGQVEKIPGLLDIHIIDVDPAWRRKGIAGMLTEHTERLAREHDFKGIEMLCTSAYTSKLAESKGFKCVYTINYKDYVGEDGKPIFDIPLPHTNVSLYIKLFEK